MSYNYERHWYRKSSNNYNLIKYEQNLSHQTSVLARDRPKCTHDQTDHNWSINTCTTKLKFINRPMCLMESLINP